MNILVLALGIAIGIIIALPIALWCYKRGFAAGGAAMAAVRIDENYELVIPLLTLYEKLGVKMKE